METDAAVGFHPLKKTEIAGQTRQKFCTWRQSNSLTLGFDSFYQLKVKILYVQSLGLDGQT
jgi:hypothetical protein